MKNYRILALSFALAAMTALSASPAHAQFGPVPSVIATPIVTKIISMVMAPKIQTPPGDVWLKAEVVHADSQSIIVREQQNEMAIHTFHFSPEMHDKMQTILDSGGFQYGDKVGIMYMPGQTVALRIIGKPSKSL